MSDFSVFNQNSVVFFALKQKKFRFFLPPKQIHKKNEVKT